MNLTYRFPAVRGLQAGREYYVSMVPLKLLSSIFPSEVELLSPELRAQRRINEARIPEIKKYIIENRDTYVFSALSVSIDGKFIFVPMNDFSEMGMLEIDEGAIFLINDGQHRKAAIEAAIQEDPSLAEEMISVVFFRDDGLKRCQQMFTDLNKYAVKTSNSLATLYDTRDEVAIATKRVIDSIDFFDRFTDRERDILGKNSSKLFTLNMIYKANQRILHSTNCSEEDALFLCTYWKILSENIVEWQDVLNRNLTKKALRENYIVSLAITISAFGKLGRYFYEHPDIEMRSYLERLKLIDWRRTNPEWVGKAIRENGKVLNGEEVSTLICNYIRQKINLIISGEEPLKENE